MLFVSAFDIITEPTRTIIMVSNFIFAIGCIILGLIALIYLKKPEKQVSKNYFIGLMIFFIIMGVARSIFIYHDFYAADDLDFLLWKIANIIVLVGFTILSYIIETHVYKKTKHLFTVIGIFFVILYSVILEKTIATYVIYAATATMIILPFILYLIIARQATGVLKKRAIVILIGMLILIIGQGTGLFVTIGILDETISLIIGPIIGLAGFILVGYGFLTMNR